MVKGGKERGFGPVLAGLALLAAYLSLFNAVGFRAEQGRSFVYVGWQESLFWLAHYSLAVPGLLLVGLGLAPWVDRPLEGALQRLAALRRRPWQALGVVFCGLLLTLALLGKRHLLLDMPITGDEYAVDFGARILAAGRLMAPVPQPREAMPLYFVYERDGLVTSFDFPGNLFFAALSLATGTGPVAYALAAAVSGLAMAWAGGLVAGRLGALTAAAFWLLSPMVLSLSYSNHPQLLSRSAVAVALACYCRLLKTSRSPPRAGARRALPPALFGAGLGLFAGLTFLARPIEAVCLLTPVAVHLSVVAWRRAALRRAWVAAALVALACALVFAWYNAQVTGAWYLQARFASPELVADLMSRETPRQLLGTNLGFNLMMLFIWFLGPPGLALAFLALGERSRSGRKPPAGAEDGAQPHPKGARSAFEHRPQAPAGGFRPDLSALAATLALGIALQLLIALFHPDTGIHLVGPIHYSECAAPLTLLAVVGLRRLRRRQTPLVLPSRLLAVLVAFFLLSLAVFNAVHSLTLRDQARVQRLPFDAARRAGLGRAVVVAEPPYRLWDLRPEIAEVRAWVATLPLPDPFLESDVLFVRPEVSPEVLARHFPDRRLYVMTYEPQGEPIRIRPLAPDGEP